MTDLTVVVVYLLLIYIATREDGVVKAEDARCPLCNGPLTPRDAFCECVPCGLMTWCSEADKAEGIKGASEEDENGNPDYQNS